MAFKVEWTEPAVEDFIRITNYLKEEWGSEIAKRFTDTTEQINGSCHATINRQNIFEIPFNQVYFSFKT